MSSFEAAAANSRLYTNILRAQWPPAVFLIGHVLPEFFRMLVYVLIGALVGGTSGMVFATTGCVVLSTMRATVSEVSDIPISDYHSGAIMTVGRNRRGLFWHYIFRALPLALVAIVDAVSVTVLLCITTGQVARLPELLGALWIVLPAICSGLAFGFVVVAPAIANDFQNLAHNAAAAILTLTSGAIVPTTALPTWIAQLGSLLPFQHTVTALRLQQAGNPFLASLFHEALVAFGWMLAASFVYAWMERRGRSTGRGLFRT